MVQFKICRYEEQLEKFVDTVDPLIEHAPAKLLEFAKAGEVETVIIKPNLNAPHAGKPHESKRELWKI